MIFSCISQHAQQGATQPAFQGSLVTGQKLSPEGEVVPLNGRPVDLALSPDQSTLAVLDSHTVDFVNTATRKVVSSTPITGSSYCGIAWSRTGTSVWISEITSDGHGRIAIVEPGSTEAPHRVSLPAQTFSAGITFSADGESAYIALADQHAVAIYSTRTLRLRRLIQVGLVPWSLTLLRDQQHLLVTERGGRSRPDRTGHGASALRTDPKTGAVLSGSVGIVNLEDGRVRHFAMGLAPSGMALTRDESLVAVANGHSDTVSILSLKTGRSDTVRLPAGTQPLLGTSPIALAFSRDGNRLYVATATTNSISVLQFRGARFVLAGAIPVGWYPSSIVVAEDGSLWVANTKGFGNRSARGRFDVRTDQGNLLHLEEPSADRLAQLTKRAAGNAVVPEPSAAQLPGPGAVQHVVLIVKENRTYDQVLGDLKQGNGDPSLTFYGRHVTPNHHALAEQFVLLDNFYAIGAISFDGHQWLEQNFVSDLTERSLEYHPRGAAWNMADPMTVSPAGFFWERPTQPIDIRIGGILAAPLRPCASPQHVPRVQTCAERTWTDTWKMYREGAWKQATGSRPALPAVAKYFDRRYPSSDVRITDQIRASVFEEEMQTAETSGRMPNLWVIALVGDHTMGTDPSAPSPAAMVADNDFALGRIVERVSRSPFWKNTLIFVVEDDAQDGVDHVNNRRTVALAISPWIKRQAVDSHPYNQLSLIHTIQAVLGIRPQTNMVATASVMDSIFQTSADLTPYQASQPEVALDQMNPGVNALKGVAREDATRSAQMDWSEVDRISPRRLNQILWHDAMGLSTAYPKSETLRGHVASTVHAVAAKGTQATPFVKAR